MTTLIGDPTTGGNGTGDGPDASRSSSQVVLELDAVGVLSYAFAHNGVPVVRQVFITNAAGRPIEGVRLDIEITTVDGRLNRPYTSDIGLLETGLTPVSTVDLRLDPARLADLEEQRPGTIAARLTLPGLPVRFARSRPGAAQRHHCGGDL